MDWLWNRIQSDLAQILSDLRSEIAPFIIKLLFALVTLILAVIVARWGRGVVQRSMARAKLHVNIIALLGNLTYAGIILLSIMALLGLTLGWAWVITYLGMIALVAGLAFQDVLKNVVSGVFILVERPFQIGDKISIDTRSGTVESIEFRTTILRTDTGQRLIVPNANLLSSAVVNETVYPTSKITLTLRLPGDSDLTEARKRVVSLLEGTQGIKRSPPPEWEITGYREGWVVIHLRFWVGKDRRVPSGFLPELKKALPGAEIEVL